MTRDQKYIIIIISLLAALFFFNKKSSLRELPNSIGEPLELVIIKNKGEFNKDFYNAIKNILSLDIGPAPQPESILNFLEIESTNFKGIFKRHQNLLFILKSDKFSVSWEQDLFAKNQQVIFLHCPSYDVLQKNNKKVQKIVNQIKQIEINRQILKYKDQVNVGLQNMITEKHDISMLLPKNFFLADSGPNMTWLRNETSKTSQGIIVLNPHKDIIHFDSNQVLNIMDSVVRRHIFGPLEKSHMTLDKEASVSLDTIKLHEFSALKLQSLWRMEHDFMGGIFNLYYLHKISPTTLIYTYVYAPGQNKKLLLMHLESIIHTIKVTY